MKIMPMWFLKLPNKLLLLKRALAVSLIVVLLCSLSVLAERVNYYVTNINSSIASVEFDEKPIKLFFNESINASLYSKNNLKLVSHNLVSIKQNENGRFILQNKVRFLGNYKNSIKMLIILYRGNMLGHIESIKLYTTKNPQVIEVNMTSLHNIKFINDK
jgi:hypothetical protein